MARPSKPVVFLRVTEYNDGPNEEIWVLQWWEVGAMRERELPIVQTKEQAIQDAVEYFGGIFDMLQIGSKPTEHHKG